MKPMYQLSAILLSIILILSISTKTYAKRGCALYGHSCYGGHGKRSEPQISNDENQFSQNPFRSDPNKELRKIMNQVLKVDYKNYSSSCGALYILNELDMNELEQPVGDEFYENQEKELRYAVYNVMRQMIENSRRNNQNNGDLTEKLTTK